jgi:serine/threonine protein kinase
MGRNNTFLLNNGDELQLSDTVRLIFYSIRPIQEVQFTPTQERERAIFAQDYLITGRLLGEGGYGKVLIGIDQATQHQLACKIVKLDHLYDKPQAPNLRLPTDPREHKVGVNKKRWPARVAACFREFDILKDIIHPNIVSIEKVFWSNNNIYIFQELVTGGDLFSFVDYKGGRLDNPQAAVVIRQVLLGLEYLHAQQIVHRDIKPDNILMTSLEDGARVVITDFGNARFLPDVANAQGQQSIKYQRMFSCVGTLEFAAPEIHKMNATIPVDEGYSKAIDMWSIGCITATVLTGEFMFADRTHPQYYENPRKVIVTLAAQCDLSILDDEYHPVWSEITSLPKDFIKRLLVLEEDGRMTATEALAHNWFANECYAAELEDLYLRSIQDWRPRPAGSQLVKRISRSLPDLSIVGLPGQLISQDTVSYHSYPGEQQMTQNIMQTLSVSQHWRAGTPLPSIRDDYANENFQFASQPTPFFYETNSDELVHQYGDVEVDEQEQHRFYDEHGDTQHEGSDQNNYTFANNEHVNTSQRQATFVAAWTDECVAHHVAAVEESCGSTKSLNNVNTVAYSQRPYGTYIQQSQQQSHSEAVLVHGTPITQDECDTGLTPEEKYKQTQCPENNMEDVASGIKHASVVVYETPPHVQADQARSSADDILDYSRWFWQEDEQAQTSLTVE